MKVTKRNDRRTDQEWIDLIQDCRTSGFSDRDWCEQHNIPLSSFYTKITRLRKKACEIPAANRRATIKCQQVVPLLIIDDEPHPCESTSADIENAGNIPALILKAGGYCLEISNYAARETILNTISALKQLC